MSPNSNEDKQCRAWSPSDDTKTPLDAKTYESLFEHMVNGVAYCQILFDEKNAVDFIYLYTNPAFHTLTGLGDVVGKRITKIVPEIRESDNSLLEIYARVARTGTPERIETFIKALGGWYALSIYCPKPEHFVAVFDVVTQRKRNDLDLAESENRFRHFASLTSDLIYSGRRSDDGSFKIDWLGGNAKNILGFGNDELQSIGCWRPVLVAEDQPLFFEKITNLSLGQSSDTIFRFKHRDGSVRYVRSYAIVESDPNNMGNPRLYGAFQDVTEHRQAEEAIRKSELFFKESQRAAFIGSYLFDFTADQWESSEVLDQIFGIDKNYVRNVQGWLSIVHPDDLAMMDRHLREDVILGCKAFNKEYRIVRKSDGETRWVIGRGEVNFSSEGNPLSLTGTIMDISERKALEHRLERQAQTDSLTGLDNRGHFLEMAERELSRVQRHQLPMALAMLDLDHFKAVNDTYGHEVGDRVLKKFAEICRKSLRSIDLMGRIGGEEFAIVFPETSINRALEVVERLREAVATTEIPLDNGLPIQITVSLGLASFDKSDVNIDVLLNRADQALYEAKRTGRNRTVVAINPT